MKEFVLNPEVRIQEYISVFQQIKNLIYQIKGEDNGKDGMSNLVEIQSALCSF